MKESCKGTSGKTSSSGLGSGLKDTKLPLSGDIVGVKIAGQPKGSMKK